MSNRHVRRTAAAIARGHLRALAKRGIKLDKRGRARKDGKPIKPEQLARAVAKLAKPKPRKTAKPTKPHKPAKPTKPRKLAKPTRVSERDAFILESLERNHLTPEVRKKYLKSLSPNVRKSLSASTKKELTKEKAKPTKRKPKPRDLSERDAFILETWDSLPTDAQQKYFKELSAKAKKRLPKSERERIEEEERAHQEHLAAEKERELLPVAQQMREALTEAINPKAWEAIRREVLFDTQRTRAILIQKDNEVVEATNEIVANVPEQPSGFRYYAIIAAVTQYPPEAGYSQRALNTDEPLTIFYFSSVPVNNSRDLPGAITAAIENIRAQLAGDTPIAIVAVHIRTEAIKES